MINKKFMLRFAAISMLAVGLSFAADAKSEIDDDLALNGFYVKAFYNPAYVGSSTFTSATDTTTPSDKYEIGYLGGGIAAGYYYGDIRVELEGLYTDITNEKATGDSNVDSALSEFHYMAGMLNAYYDIAINDMVIPYAGAGVGMAMLTTNGKFNTGENAEDSTSYPIVLQGKIGATFNTGTSFMPYAGYRMLYTMKADAKGADEAKKIEYSYLMHNLEAGVMVEINT